jgi:hypothetical protein
MNGHNKLDVKPTRAGASRRESARLWLYHIIDTIETNLGWI